MVEGEQVRVAGANVGDGRVGRGHDAGRDVGLETASRSTKPGKAIIVMEITDPGFQDFRSDATCQIRPQSLIGEKFVDCRPTLPRAPGTPPPPPLKKIPDGEAGAGQYLLPLGNNGTSVDPDLINDIQTLPYAQRFRLILNELGAGLAGRGEDLEESGQARQPGAARRRQGASASSPTSATSWRSWPATPTQILGPLARERAQRRRLLHQRRRRRPGELGTRRRAGRVAAEVPRLPARVRADDAQPAGLLRRGHAGLRRPRQSGALADGCDPDPDPVLGSDHRGAEEPRRRPAKPPARSSAKPNRSVRKATRTGAERRRARRPNWRSC